jgi:hypothetical protein
MKRIFKSLSFLFLFYILIGCNLNTEHLLYVPTTPEERMQIIILEAQLLHVVPSVLSGYDQDWDDAIRTAHDVACRTICEPTLWEYNGFISSYTGKWRYLNTEGIKK